MASASAPDLDGRAFTLLAFLALQSGIQPILTQKFTAQGICLSSVIMVQEFVKCGMAFAMLVLSGSFRTAVSGWTITSWMTVALLPATLYAVQNVAALLAYQNLDSVTFMVLNQTKTPSAALCCYLIMGRQQSPIQLVSLVLLLVSALMMKDIISVETLMLSTSDESSKIETMEWNSEQWTHGVVPILFASFISGLSGAISQKSLQLQGGGRNAYLFSMELSMASALVLVCSLFFSPDGQQISEDGFWNQWTINTWIPILTNSAGGVVVGLVTKYCGSVRKGFGLVFGIFLGGLVQAILQPEVGVSVNQAAGGILAAISLLMHTVNPPLVRKKEKVN
eukprot:Nitzschia sp. Nitz4//scaffold161_size51353//45905//47003//NITZ4_006960-RA/size51353-snap-gene-0.7-mRNA-1//1//CDS//3329537945//2181//frame0